MATMATMAATATLGLPPSLPFRRSGGPVAVASPSHCTISRAVRSTAGSPPPSGAVCAARTCVCAPGSAGSAGPRSKAWGHAQAPLTRLVTRASQDQDQFRDRDGSDVSDQERRDEDWREAEREAAEELRTAPGAPQALDLSVSDILPPGEAQELPQDEQQQRQGSNGKGKGKNKGNKQGSPPTSPPPAETTVSGKQQRGAAQSVQWTGDSPPSAEPAPQDGTPGAAGAPLQEEAEEGSSGPGVPQAGQLSDDPVVRGYQERGVEVAAPTTEAPPQQAPPPGAPATRGGSGGGGMGTPGVRRTVWGQADLEAKHAPLREDASADVVVVGAGINGLSLAHELQCSGMDVIVLEGRVVGAGQTGKTTAHLMPWNDDYYSILESLYGRRVAAAVGESHRCAIARVGRVVEEEGIDCDFRTVDGYLFPHQDTRSTLNTLLQEYEAAKRAGFSDVALVDLKGDPRMGSLGTALKFPNAADFHPLKYLDGLAEAFVRRGGRLYENTRVTSDEPERVRTSTGRTVTARRVVLATSSPINHNLLVHARQHADRSYVVGLRVPPGEIPPAQWWDTASPYHYVRTVKEGEHPSGGGGDILLVGGEDHPAGALSPVEYPAAYLRLENWARERWPMAQEVVYKWSGQVYKPIDFLGLYGKEPSATCGPQFTISTGNSGQGMTGGTISAIVIADEILGRSNPWRHAYSPQRLPPPSGQVLQSAAMVVQDTVQGYLEDLPFVGDDWASVRKLSNGSGAVVTRGLAKVAAYKDSKGEVHQYSAVCPHLKCAVKWNPIDETFDCPCHGSQFDTKGRCIQGPAKADLPPV